MVQQCIAVAHLPHVENVNACNTVSCWNENYAPVANEIPFTLGEMGKMTVEATFSPIWLAGLIPLALVRSLGFGMQSIAIPILRSFLTMTALLLATVRVSRLTSPKPVLVQFEIVSCRIAIRSLFCSLPQICDQGKCRDAPLVCASAAYDLSYGPGLLLRLDEGQGHWTPEPSADDHRPSSAGRL